MSHYCQISFLVFAVLFSGLVRVLIIRHSNWFRQGLVADASVHYKIVELFRGNKRPNLRINNYLIPSEMYYPVAYHWFVSKFSKDSVDKYQYIPNLLIYFIMIFVLMGYSFHLFLQITGHALIPTALVLVLYTSSVQNLLVTESPAINYITLSERLLGKFATSMYYFGLFGFMAMNDTVGAALAIAGSTMSVLSSKFSIQSVVFGSLVASIVFLNASPLFFLAIGLFLGIAVSGGYAFKTVVNTFRYLVIYYKYGLKSRYIKPALSTYMSVRRFIGCLYYHDFKCAIKEVTRREPGRALLFYPEIWIILILGGLVYSENGDSALNTGVMIVAVIVFLYLVTSIKHLSFVGESYRYIEYCLDFLAPFLMVYIFQLSGIPLFYIFLIVIYSMFIAFLFHQVKKHWYRNDPPPADDLAAFLKVAKVTSDDVIFPVTMRLGADIVARADCKSFQDQPGGIVDASIYKEYFCEPPYLSTDWRKLCERHGVTKIIVDNDALSRFHGNYDFSELEIIAKNNRFTAYQYR